MGAKGSSRVGGKPPLPVMMNLLFCPCRQGFWSRRLEISGMVSSNSTSPSLGSTSGVLILTSPLNEAPNFEVAVMSLLSVASVRNLVPNMPAAVMLTRPPNASTALAEMSLLSGATKFSVLMVMLPPVAVPSELVVMLLLLRRMRSLLLLMVMLPLSPTLVSAVSFASFSRRMLLLFIIKSPAAAFGSSDGAWTLISAWSPSLRVSVLMVMVPADPVDSFVASALKRLRDSPSGDLPIISMSLAETVKFPAFP